MGHSCVRLTETLTELRSLADECINDLKRCEIRWADDHDALDMYDRVKKIKEKIKDGDLDALQKYGFHGNVAPTLDGVAERYNEAELRMIVVDAKMAFPDFDTSMPAYHRNQGLERVLGDCDGLVILPAERVEDIVAFLTTLKD